MNCRNSDQRHHPYGFTVGFAEHAAVACLVRVCCAIGACLVRFFKSGVHRFYGEISMNEKNKAILSGVAGRKKRSQLTPHRDLICKLHQRGCAFREIARILSENFSLAVAHTTICRFITRMEQETVQVRKTKPRKGTPVKIMPVTPTATVKSIPVSAASPDEVRQRIAALKQQREQLAPTAKQFDYNPEQPLHLVPEDE